MVEKVRHPKLGFAYRCTEPGCTRAPFVYRDEAEECERDHQLRRTWAAERDRPAERG